MQTNGEPQRHRRGTGSSNPKEASPSSGAGQEPYTGLRYGTDGRSTLIDGREASFSGSAPAYRTGGYGMDTFASGTVRKPRRKRSAPSGSSGRKLRKGAVIASAAVGACVLLILILALTGVFAPRFSGAAPAGNELAKYGRGYSGYIFRYAKEYEVPCAYVAAIIKNESSYNRFAESSAGARGLMQFMPKTGAWAAEKAGITDYTDDMLYEAGPNIRMGCWYLRWIQRNYFGEDLILTTCSYHAGQSNVQSWLKKYSPDGKTLTLEQIPMKDTKTYATRVMNDYQVYRDQIYCFTWEDQIRSCAAYNGIPSAYPAAMILYGSKYQPGLVTADPDGLREDKYGLMQMTLPMAQQAAKELGYGDIVPGQIAVPENSITLGCRYLKTLWELYDGDMVKIACAWWAGTEQCGRWISQAERAGTPFTLDSIPDSGTREYVKGVNDAFEFYLPYYQD